MTSESPQEDNKLNQQIIQWGLEYILSQGYSLKTNLPEKVQNTPWSYVIRFATSDGYIYLKSTPKLLAIEADIVRILHDQFNAPVPEIIAKNTELNCFLMRDAGRTLRGILKEKFDANLLCKAIDKFTSMQMIVAGHVNVFLDIGVPDWRLDKLPDLYMELLSQKDILIADGLSAMEIAKLEDLLPTVSNLCKRLSNYPVMQSIVQPDFHDNNTLVTEVSQKITIIDLGEIVISHPFFSLINCLHQMKKHYGLEEQDDVYIQIQDAFLKNYMNFDSKMHILEAFSIAKILLSVYGALAHYRLTLACDKEKLESFQRHGRLSGQLKEFMIACSDTDK